MVGGSSENEDEWEGSSMVGNIVMVGATVAAVAWLYSKLFSKSSTSSDQNEHTNYYILHFNGSDINQHDKGGAGCIIRNKEGELVVAGAYNLDDLNKHHPKEFHVAIAGAEALLNGLKLAKKYTNNGKLHLIKGKNDEVINRVLDQQKRPPEHEYLTKLIAEIQHAIDPETLKRMRGEEEKKFTKNKKEEEENEVAHELAYYGSKKLKFGDQRIYFREGDLPPKVAELLEQDKNIWRAQN